MDIRDLKPADRTDAVLMDAIENRVANTGRLTWREERRLAEFLKTFYQDHPQGWYAFGLKDRALRRECLDATGHPGFAKVATWTHLERLDFATRHSHGGNWVLTPDQVLTHRELVMEHIERCQGDFYGLSITTVDHVEAFLDAHGIEMFFTIPPEFQTVAMAIKAVSCSPSLFQYVASPTRAVLEAFVTTYEKKMPLRELVEWIPADLDLQSFRQLGLTYDPFIKRLEEARRPPAPAPAPPANLDKNELNRFELKVLVERLMDPQRSGALERLLPELRKAVPAGSAKVKRIGVTRAKTTGQRKVK